MIETIILDYLDEELSAAVYMGEEPEEKPAEYVVLKMIDGGRINHIDAATFNITSYAPTLYRAAELNAEVKSAMFDAVSIDEVSSSKCGGGGQRINTTTKAYAYECVFNIYYMED